MRYSKQRNLILEIVKSTTVHPTAEWVYAQAREKMPTIGIATVYRNLKLLVELGEIRKIDGVDGLERYDGNICRHYHFRCRQCGRLIDLPAKSQKALELMDQTIKDTFEFQKNEVVINMTLLEGICEDCISSDNEMSM